MCTHHASAHDAFQELVEEEIERLLTKLDVGQEELLLALIGDSPAQLLEGVPPERTRASNPRPLLWLLSRGLPWPELPH